MGSLLSGALSDTFGTISNLFAMFWPYVLIGTSITIAGVLIARVQGK